MRFGHLILIHGDARCSGFPTHPSRSSSQSLSAHPCRVGGGFASRFIRRCVDTQREGGGIYLRFSSYFLLPILQMLVEGGRQNGAFASILTHLPSCQSEAVSSNLGCLIQQFHIPIVIIQSQSLKIIRTATSTGGLQDPASKWQLYLLIRIFVVVDIFPPCLSACGDVVLRSCGETSSDDNEIDSDLATL